MLDKYSSSDLSNLHAVTQQYIQALTKKAIDSGLKTVSIKGVEYKIGSRKSGKGYAYKPVKCEEVVNVVEVVEAKKENDIFSKFFDKKSFLNVSNGSCSEECTTTTISTTSPILGLGSDKANTLEELSDDEKEKIFFKKRYFKSMKHLREPLASFKNISKLSILKSLRALESLSAITKSSVLKRLMRVTAFLA